MLNSTKYFDIGCLQYLTFSAVLNFWKTKTLELSTTFIEFSIITNKFENSLQRLENIGGNTKMLSC